jgi:hypothetical protein
MHGLVATIREFISQPFGAVGAACIMLAVTSFNSRRLRARFTRLGMGARGLGRLLNGLNLVGGLCLLVNAVLRTEVVWEVLEVYFVIIAFKGLLQTQPTESTQAVAEGDPVA